MKNNKIDYLQYNAVRTIVLSMLSIVVLCFNACKEDPFLSEAEPELEAEFLKNQTIRIDGIDRAYHIYLPRTRENKPVVMLLHGHGGSFDQSIGEEYSKNPQRLWIDVAEENEIILIIPNGALGSEDTRGWNDCREDAFANPETDDVKFLSELLDKISSEYLHDTKRVYICGISNGASMAIRLAQEIPNKITAFASVITTMAVNSECADSDIPVSAIFMNGTADPIAPYDGGTIVGGWGEVTSTSESLAYWISRNGTSTVPVIETLADVDTNDDSHVKKYTYDNGANNTEVVLYEIVGGGHTEPSLVERYAELYLALVGRQNGDIEMADAVWDFFRKKSK